MRQYIEFIFVKICKKLDQYNVFLVKNNINEYGFVNHGQTDSATSNYRAPFSQLKMKKMYIFTH